MTTNFISQIKDTRLKDKLRLKSALMGKPLIGPKSVNIHIINSCNYRCEFCWYFSPFVKSHPPKKMLDFKVLKRVLEDCAQMGVDQINFEGGEVTLYPGWLQAFRMVKKLGMELVVYSHLGVNPRCLPGLCLASQLTVNFSAMSEESFKKIHGSRASFKLVSKNIERLLAIRQKRGAPKIVLSFVLYSSNFHELEAFLEMAQQRRVDKVVIRFFKATQQMKDLVFTKKQLISLRNIVKSALQKSYSFQHDLNGLYHLISDKQVLVDVEAMRHSKMHNDRLLFYDSTGGKIHCHTGWFYANIDEKGRVVAPCDNVGVCVAGNVNEQSFKEIWFHSDFLHHILVEASNGIRTSSPKWRECRYCSYVSINQMIHDKIIIL
ncbi:MAG: radical SAM protein [Candidatus Omnitrophica bacterium]|nr:radical SAM protein [Candidatus Omnitrophota bacterium]